MSLLAIAVGLALPVYAQEDPDETPAYDTQEMQDDEDDVDVDVDVDTDLDEPDADIDVQTTPPPAPAPVVERTTVIVDDDDLDDDLNDDDFMQLQIGASYGQFVGDVAESATGVGGNWDVRALFGSDSIIGLEAAYVGSAQSISGLGLEDNNLLLGTGAEADLRLAPQLSAGEVEITPFAFGGVGFAHYNIIGEDVAETASVEEMDNVVTLPAGVGLELGFGPVSLEGRATYRHAFDSELFGPSNGFDERSLSAWDIGGGIGFEF